MSLKIYTDGGARGNPGPAASGCVIYHQDATVAVKLSKYLGVATNNIAEYQGVILALGWLDAQITNKEACELEFYLDSNLVVSQLSRKFKIKNEELISLAARVFKQIGEYKSVSFNHIPREQNATADLLVNQCLDENI